MISLPSLADVGVISLAGLTSGVLEHESLHGDAVLLRSGASSTVGGSRDEVCVVADKGYWRWEAEGTCDSFCRVALPPKLRQTSPATWPLGFPRQSSGSRRDLYVS